MSVRQDEEESFELGLPFTTQDIPELEGVPDVTKSSRLWGDYMKDGYCVRSIGSLRPADFRYLDRFSKCVRNDKNLIWYEMVHLENLESIIMRLEEAMDDCYRELTALVGTLEQIRWLPLRYVYWAYTCQKFNALLDTLSNALSVGGAVSHPLVELEAKRRDRNVKRADGDFGGFVLENAVIKMLEDTTFPFPLPTNKWMWLYSSYLQRQDPRSLGQTSHLPITPKSMSITPEVKARWFDEMAWRTTLSYRQLSEIWNRRIRTWMSDRIDSLLVPGSLYFSKLNTDAGEDFLHNSPTSMSESKLILPHCITLKDLCCTRNEDGTTRTTRLDCQNPRTRKSRLRARSCSAKIDYHGSYEDRYRSTDLYRLLVQRPELGQPETLSYLRPPAMYDWARTRKLRYWEDNALTKARVDGLRNREPIIWTGIQKEMMWDTLVLGLYEAVVVGWFPGKKGDPREMCIRFLPGSSRLFFHQLYLHILVLRGWRSFFSFKTVQGFGLYKCEVRKGAHGSYEMSDAVKATLGHFFHAYNRGDSNPETNILWAEWCQTNLSGGRGVEAPCESQLSLKLILKWSQWRLTAASCVPLALSFIIGMWYQFTYDDAQGAWTIGSNIGSSGAFIIALLAVLTQLKDG